MANPKSIFSRKRDLAYLVFFLIHIPVLLCKNPQNACSLTSTTTKAGLHMIKKRVRVPTNPVIRRRPRLPLPRSDQTSLHHHPPRILHHNLRRPLLQLPAGMVQHVRVGGADLPLAAVLLGDWSSHQR
jgi:hypothetical protein